MFADDLFKALYSTVYWNDRTDQSVFMLPVAVHKIRKNSRVPHRCEFSEMEQSSQDQKRHKEAPGVGWLRL